MSSAEGWAAQRCGLPAAWYADVEEVSGIGFPISGDATTIVDHHQPVRRDVPLGRWPDGIKPTISETP